MALNFPDTPTLHQQFTAGGRTWVWNGSAWVAYRGTSTVTAQNSAPSAPAEGSMWFNTITEQTSVYYNSEWVPIATAVTDNSAGDAFTVIQSGAGRAMNVTGDVDVDGTVDATVLTQGGSAVALSSDLSSHSSDTTSVHGITDTANLVYTSDARLTDTRTPTDGSVSTAKIADGAVTSAKIANGTIVDEDVSATAAIAQSKIANLTTDLASKASSATVSAHTSATTDVHGIADTADLATKSYADSAAATAAAGVVDAAPATLDTLNELAAALGDDPNFATTTATALGNRVRVDAAQTLTAGQKTQARSNIDAASSAHAATHAAAGSDAITISPSQVTGTAVVTTDARLSDTRTPTDNTVSTAKIVDGAVTSAKIADGTIVDGDVNASAAIAQSKISGLTTDLAAKAPLASPTFTGTVTAPTLNVSGTADTATAASHYYVETDTDGVVRPKTLANVRAEVVTTAAVNTAAATTVGTVTSGVWNATAIGATYIDSALARLASPTFTGTPAAPTAAAGTNTTQIATTSFVTSAVNNSRIAEPTADGTISANVVNLDSSVTNVLYIGTAPTANFTVNVTNVPTTNNQAITITLTVVQGATGFIPSALQISGTGQTIKWQGGSAPTPTNGAGKIDLFSFTLIRRASAWTVFGSALVNF